MNLICLSVCPGSVPRYAFREASWFIEETGEWWTNGPVLCMGREGFWILPSRGEPISLDTFSETVAELEVLTEMFLEGADV